MDNHGRQARKDASADAATLLDFAYQEGCSQVTFFVLESLQAAAEDVLCSVITVDEEPQWAFIKARVAARAAFMAVPGLRA